MFDRVFLAHPRSLGEGYFEHQQAALGFAGDLILAGFACAIHAVIPRMVASRLSHLSEAPSESTGLSVG